MRIFEPLEEFEFYDGERLIGVYMPGLRYNCEEGDVLNEALEQWLSEGKVKIVEEHQGQGTQQSSVGGQGEVE